MLLGAEPPREVAELREVVCLRGVDTVFVLRVRGFAVVDPDVDEERVVDRVRDAVVLPDFGAMPVRLVAIAPPRPSATRVTRQ